MRMVGIRPWDQGERERLPLLLENSSVLLIGTSYLGKECKREKRRTRLSSNRGSMRRSSCRCRSMGGGSDRGGSGSGSGGGGGGGDGGGGGGVRGGGALEGSGWPRRGHELSRTRQRSTLLRRRNNVARRRRRIMLLRRWRRRRRSICIARGKRDGIGRRRGEGRMEDVGRRRRSAGRSARKILVKRWPNISLSGRFDDPTTLKDRVLHKNRYIRSGKRRRKRRWWLRIRKKRRC